MSSSHANASHIFFWSPLHHRFSGPLVSSRTYNVIHTYILVSHIYVVYSLMINVIIHTVRFPSYWLMKMIRLALTNLFARQVF